MEDNYSSNEQGNEAEQSTSPQDQMQVSRDSKNIGMLCHMLGLVANVSGFFGFVGPLVLWLMKKDEDAFVEDQGRESLNWQLTMIIATGVGIVTAFFFIGILIIVAALICNIIFCIMGGVKASNGEKYRYPFSLRLIK